MATVIDARSLVDAIERSRPQEPSVAYEFSNGRKFYHDVDPYAGTEEYDGLFPWYFESERFA